MLYKEKSSTCAITTALSVSLATLNKISVTKRLLDPSFFDFDNGEAGRAI